MGDEEMKRLEELEEVEGEEEKWVKYYSSNHQILLVGEGDFSFSLSLAQSFGSASNMVASSLDLYDDVIKKYKKAKPNLENLENLGAFLLHGVDATKMKLHPDLQMRRFDYIIYNFPHAGFYRREDDSHMIKKHKDLVHGFFMNARGMLRPDGEIHVNHKTTAPFSYWNVESLAMESSLQLVECVRFKKEDYPGYNNKRGDGLRCDEPFPLGECSTYKFSFNPNAKMMPKVKARMDLLQRRYPQLKETQVPMQQRPTAFDLGYPPFQEIQVPMQQRPTSFDLMRYPQTNKSMPLTNTYSQIRCSEIISRYSNNPAEILGRRDYDVGYSTYRLMPDFERLVAEVPTRTLNGDCYLLHELHRMSIMRSARFRRMLAFPDYNLNETEMAEYQRYW
ncbi:DUF2431 domain-containing protein [Quillaja saponaria]|uniref:DUF2431 domain-containing protein n=1 Tax=Quillaja saponaria TaxID=32244 RepID=A0AAD7LP81_QUISA|nr:DUF2431 domain-containing protein [Quillaja saponaria]